MSAEEKKELEREYPETVPLNELTGITGFVPGATISLTSVFAGKPVYAPDINRDNFRAHVCIWKGTVQDDVRAKSKFIVEAVENHSNQIRLRSKFWDGHYLYTPAINYDPRRRMVCRWRKGEKSSDVFAKEHSDVFSKARLEVEPVGTSGEIILRSVHFNREYIYAVDKWTQEGGPPPPGDQYAKDNRGWICAWKDSKGGAPPNDPKKQANFKVHVH